MECTLWCGVGRRSSEHVALPVVHTDLAQSLEHRLALDALGDGLLAHNVPDVVNRTHHRQIKGIVVDALNERTINLEEVDRQVLEVGERR